MQSGRPESCIPTWPKGTIVPFVHSSGQTCHWIIVVIIISFEVLCNLMRSGNDYPRSPFEVGLSGTSQWQRMNSLTRSSPLMPWLIRLRPMKKPRTISSILSKSIKEEQCTIQVCFIHKSINPIRHSCNLRQILHRPLIRFRLESPHPL